MSTKIKGSEFPLAKIFSSDFDYNIPSFQRPYSWTEDQTRELFNDLHDFYVEESSEEQYFLGSIVLVKEDDKPHSEVIDGQQRLTTLTILLAALTSRLTGDNRADFKNYIIEPGRASQGIVPKPRLQLRKVDNPFFCTYVQEMQFDKLFGLNPDMLPTEAQQNILLNAKLLMDLLVANFASEAELVRFGAFLVQRCLLIVVSTPTEQSAFRIFSVMNNRGMDLLVTDIIKADVIFTIITNGHAVTGITEEGEALQQGVDFAINGSQFRFNQSYLETLSEGVHTYHVGFATCPDLVLTITVTGSTVTTTETTTEPSETTTTTTTTETTSTETEVTTGSESETTTTTTDADTDTNYGDVNLDGKVDLVDAITMNKYLAGQITLSEQATKNADVNADGSLGDGDSTTLMQFVLMMIPNLPA